MPEPDRVADLVNAIARRTFHAERHELLSALPADAGRAAASGTEGHKIRFGRSLNEPDRRVGVPMRNSVGDTVSVGEISGDSKRHLLVLPTEAELLDRRTERFNVGFRRRRIVAQLLGLLFDL